MVENLVTVTVTKKNKAVALLETELEYINSYKPVICYFARITVPKS